MMQRRHLENSLLAQLIRSDLQNYRERFDYEHSSDKWQQQFLLDDYCNRSDCAAERERSYISHENFRGMRVIPQKSNCRADHGSAENRQLANLRHFWNFQISRESSMAAHIGQDSQRPRRDHGATDGKSVQAIGEIDGVARSHDDQRDECNEWQERQRPEMRHALEIADGKVGMELFEEWHDQFR